MNIFVTDKDPIIAAQNLCDKHIPKMATESLQMLGSAVLRHGARAEQMPLTKAGTSLKGGYQNHPCTRWAGESRSNFNWLILHAREQCKEYTKRFGKVHFCESGINQLDFLGYLIPPGPLTDFAIAINENSNCRRVAGFDTKPVFEKYRLFYKMDKPFAKWEKGRKAPNWFTT